MDVIYNPLRTALLLSAQDLGVPCANGLYMLVAQAARAARLFTGGGADREPCRAGLPEARPGRVQHRAHRHAGLRKDLCRPRAVLSLGRPLIDTEYGGGARRRQDDCGNF